jgi:hypothetical protein
MKKSLFTTAILLTVLTGFSQGFLSFGAGVSTKSKGMTAELFGGGVFGKSLFLAAGFQTVTSNVKTEGCQFQGRIGIQFRGISSLIVTPQFGVSQFYRSSDDKSLNVTRPLYAIDLSLPVRDDRGNLFLGASFSDGKCIISGGIRCFLTTVD